MERINRQLPNLRKLAQDDISWISCARRPLTTVELQHAMAVEDCRGRLDLITDSLPDVEDMVAVCAGLVTVDSETGIVRLVHKTTQEYFDRRLERWVPDTHATIAKICAKYLSFKAFSSGLCATTKEFKRRLRTYPLYQYAALNWGYHARRALHDFDEVINFLRNEGQVEAASQVLHPHGQLRGSELSSGSLKYRDCFDAKSLLHHVKGLHLAAYFGLERVTTQLLARNDDPDMKTSHGRTPLSYAAEKGHKAVVRALLATGQVEVDKMDGLNRRTPLYYAVFGGHGAVVQTLLDTGQVDLPSYCCGDLLSDAASTGCEPLVRVLLASDLTDINWEDVKQYTALHHAAMHGQTSVVRMLLATGKADIHRESVDGTPLMLAAHGGHDAVVQLLLATNRVDVNDADPCSQTTPLMCAAAHGSSSVVHVLLATGQVDVNARDREGRTALHHAAGCTFPEGRILETVELLLAEEKVEVDCKDMWDRTPLSYASEAGHEVVVQALLLTAQVDPNARTSALSSVEAGGYEDRVMQERQFLIHWLPDPMTKEEDGWTPLTYAIKRGHKAVASLLRAHGAQDAAGST
jgi:ankyrin repeat protein